MFMLLQAGAETAAATATPYVWDQAGAPGKSIIILLGLLSIFVWSVMLQKGLQTRKARKLNRLFVDEFHQHDGVLVIHDRNIHGYSGRGSPALRRVDEIRRQRAG